MSSTYERLFELSTGLLATVDDSGRFLDLNPAWEQMLGWTLAELRAQAPLELIHPDDRQTAIAEGARMMQGERMIHYECRFRCRDGRYKWLMWSSFVDVDPETAKRVWYATAVDISEYKELLRAQEETLSRLRLFEAMLENTTDQVGIVDMQGAVIYRNGTARRDLLARGQSEAETRMTVSHSPEFTERLYNEVRTALLTEGRWSGEGDLMRPDGTIMPTYQVTIALKDASGTPLGYGSLIRDISAVKQIETQLRAAVQALATPLIPISERVVVMPLIGQMDVERASQVTRVALDGVHGRCVEVVILDVTGLQNLDAEVATLLLNTARSLALLGVRTVLTGIQPVVARTLIGLGLDLSGIETASTLQSAIAFALAPRTSRRV